MDEGEQSLVAGLPVCVEEHDAGKREQHQAEEQAVHGTVAAAERNSGQSEQGDESEYDGNQQRDQVGPPKNLTTQKAQRTAADGVK